MNPLMRVLVVLIAISALAGPASAESSIVSPAVRAEGVADLQGQSDALFMILDESGLVWDGEATSVTLERTFSTWTAVSWPVNDNYAFQNYDPVQTATETFGPSTLRGGQALVGGAILVKSNGGATVSAQSEGLLTLAPQRDPRFDQGWAADATAGQMPALWIHEGLQGEYVNATLPGGVLELRGDLLLVLFGADYELAGAAHRTGEFTTRATGPVTEGSVERHVLRLEDATLRIRAITPLYLLTSAPTVNVQGTVEADASASSSGSRWTGLTALSVAATDGLLAVSAPGAATQGSAIVAQGPPVLVATLVLLALFAIAAIALLVWRRRERPDDLALALLAMEERRWADALPPLTRLVAKRPGDAGVVVDRALCLEQLGRLREAARAFESALRASPRHAEAHFYYARTLARLQQREAGRVHLETALEIDPRLAEMARSEPIFRTL